LRHVAPRPIPSLEQIVRRQAPSSSGILQEPSGLPYRGETVFGFDLANDNRHLRQLSDSHPLLIGPQRAEALNVPARSASNATFPATQLDTVFSTPLSTGPETPSSSLRRSRQRANSTQGARARARPLPEPRPTYYYCDCGKKFVLISERTKHQKYHPKMGDRQYPCRYCQPESGRVDFADLRDHNRHMFKVHPEHYTGPPPLEAWKKVTCEFCEKEYSRGDGLKRHLEKTPKACGGKAKQKSSVVTSSSSFSSSMGPQEEMPVPKDNPTTSAAGPTERNPPTRPNGSDALTTNIEAGQQLITENMSRSLPSDMVRMRIDPSSRELSNGGTYSPDPVFPSFHSQF
jgi:hypothetical protein